tara:strand:- start:7198 stop:7395 length:198 start_codon:yes stop_codon:yes gene_type:complete
MVWIVLTLGVILTIGGLIKLGEMANIQEIQNNIATIENFKKREGYTTDEMERVLIESKEYLSKHQ